MGTFIKWIAIILIVLIAIGFIVGNQDVTSSSQNQTTTSSREIVMTDEMRRDVTAAIQKAGYNCPEAKLSYAEGEDAYGTVTKIYCGPKGQSGVYEKAVFRFTFLPNDQIKVQP